MVIATAPTFIRVLTFGIMRPYIGSLEVMAMPIRYRSRSRYHNRSRAIKTAASRIKTRTTAWNGGAFFEVAILKSIRGDERKTLDDENCGGLVFRMCSER